MSEEIIWWCLPISASALMVSLLMMVTGYVYLNFSKRKARLAELAFGPNNKWTSGARIDFFDANYLFAMIPTNALAMKVRVKMGKSVPKDVLHPCLDLNENYNRVWQEFRFYSIWISTLFCIAMIFFVFGGISMAHDKG